MTRDTILSEPRAERDRLHRATAALEGPAPGRGRPKATPATVRRMSAEARRKISEFKRKCRPLEVVATFKALLPSELFLFKLHQAISRQVDAALRIRVDMAALWTGSVFSLMCADTAALSGHHRH